MTEQRPLKLIVLTDLHIPTEGETIIGIDPGVRFAEALAHVAQNHRDADHLIIMGDLAHYGDEVGYGRLSSMLAAIDLPFTLLLGNHDRRETFLSVFPSAIVDQYGFVQSIADKCMWRLIFLDTLNGPPYDHNEIHAGHLCRKRLEWLDAALAQAGQRQVLLFMHHPPHAVGFDGMDSIRLRDEPAFFDVLARHRNVRHIFAGHIHRTISGSVRGIPFSVFKSPVHQQPLTFDSLDTSLSVAEPGAYGIVIATDRSVLVHTEDYTLSTPIA